MKIAMYLEQYRKELQLKNYAESSIELYVNSVYRFLRYFESSYPNPEKITVDVIKEWLRQSPSQAILRIRIGALKNFYYRVIHQPLKFKYIEYPKKERRLPQILDVSEVQAMFDVCSNTKHKCIMAILYSCGARVGEIINLRINDIDEKLMVIRIIQSKGKKDRIVPLKEKLLELINKYISEYKPVEFLFNGQGGAPQYSERSINAFLQTYAEKAGIKKRVYAHLFRHTSLTNMLESGDDLHTVQIIAGHNRPSTTNLYLHISPKFISRAANHVNALSF